MPFKLDQIDVKILKALLEDGRRSYREIAKIIGISAPTVEARLKRIMQSGLILRIAPIFDVSKLNGSINVLISIKADVSKLNYIASEIANLPEVKSVFLTTGENNLLVRIVESSYDKIESLSSKIALIEGVSIISTQIVTKTVKDEQGIIIEPELGVKLSCDYCKKEIVGDPLILKVQDSERFFCCKTCLSAYKEKYGSRMRF
ncbi:MAG: AsnC family transcriptional regulator [Candidatus Bathyarchaeia archaeon]